MEIRTGTLSDWEAIKQFVKEQHQRLDPNYDIDIELGKIYSKYPGKHSSEHILAIEHNKIIGIGLNHLQTLNYQGHDFLFSIVGNLLVDPAYQNQGVMTKIMNEINQINKNREVVFSVLKGRRERFRHFGYEKGPYIHHFMVDDYLLKHSKFTKDTTIQLMRDEDVEECYEFYLKNTKAPIRDRENFLLTLKTNHSTPYVVYQNDKRIGYLVFNRHHHSITECSIEVNELFSAISNLLEVEKLHAVSLLLSPLEREKNHFLASHCEGLSIIQDQNLKIYNWISFFKLIISANIIEFDSDTDLIIQVDDKTYEIDIEYPVVGVWPSHRKPNIKVDSTTAVMLFFSPLSHRNAPFLPFHFHIPSPDML